MGLWRVAMLGIAGTMVAARAAVPTSEGGLATPQRAGPAGESRAMTDPLHVLLVEDSATDAKLIIQELRRTERPVEFERVETAPAMRDALQRKEWDIVLSDWSMPHFTALAALATLREAGLDLPFIIVSGTMGEETAVHAMQAGAQDFVVKDRLGRLVPAVEREVRECKQRAARRKAEDALRESELRFRRLAESGLVGINVAEISGRILDANDAFLDMVGYSREELGSGLVNWAELTPPEWRSLSTEAFEDLRATGIARPWAKEYLRKDGSRVPVLVCVATFGRDKNISLVIDLTELKQAEAARRHAEEALRESEEEYRVLFESSPLPKFVYDLDTLRFLAVNDAAVRTYGYSRDELIAMTVLDIRPPEDRPGAVGRVQNSALEGSIGIRRHQKKDGIPFDVEIHAHTFAPDAAGRRRRLIVAQDVTERKRLEEQLRQAQKMEAVGRLAGGVAHDFNNILSVILSYGEMLLADLPPGEPMRDDVDEIAKAGRRAVNLTRQLLSFSRQQVLEPRVLEPNDLLANIDKMLRRILGADVDLASVPGEGLGRVRADPGSLEQVVMNLVVNARDAMPTGGKLTIETANVELDEEYASQHPDSKPGPHVMIAVSDTGTGMDAATRARIFEPFFTTKEQGKGTGLGLSTVFGIVHQSGGTVWVYSEVGKGTTFKVFLPRVDAHVDSVQPTAPQATAHGTETILLVDDDEPVRLVARTILQKNGYRVIEAGNAGEALLHAESHPGPIHLLVTDVVMPRMSGPTLAQRLAAGRPGMKVLCMSGYTDDSIVRHGIIEGSIAFLQKPVTPQGLARKVRAVLDGNGS
jgi:two-component system, cell cycle sensor histidine kinase and response regulator CckA